MINVYISPKLARLKMRRSLTMMMIFKTILRTFLTVMMKITRKKSMNNNKTKSARSVCQFFLTSVEGDFSWPVASFPVYSVTVEKLTNNMIWPLIRMLNEVSNGYIKIVYGVCDGGTWNYSFFQKKTKTINLHGLLLIL